MREFIQDHAIRVGGRLFYGVAPGSHYKCMKLVMAALGNLDNMELGYLTSWGRFVLPREAKRIAERDAGSNNGCWAPCLISAQEILTPA